MSKIEKNKSLKTFNTFGLECTASNFSRFTSIEELRKILEEFGKPTLILGGGSNVLFVTTAIDGLVLLNEIKGIHLDPELNRVTAGSGVIWDDLVSYCVNIDLGGLENLSLIPGTVGAAPMQNIGAYGVEVKDSFLELEALNLNTLEIEKFFLNDCEFGYRESVFKKKLKGKYIITSVSFQLNKNGNLNLNYGSINEILKEKNIKNPSIADVRQTVIEIRESKLPNPKVLGNAGSFFKNPELPVAEADKLSKKYPALPVYVVNENTRKIPAGWLIEQAGWKGKRFGNVGVHKNQALVIVNYGGGTGKEIEELSKDIQKDIVEKFGVSLEPEVNFIY